MDSLASSGQEDCLDILMKMTLTEHSFQLRFGNSRGESSIFLICCYSQWYKVYRMREKYFRRQIY